MTTQRKTVNGERLTVTAHHTAVTAKLWQEAQASPEAAYLPYVCREVIDGKIDQVVMSAVEWSKLHGFLMALPSGKKAMAISVAEAPEEEPREHSVRSHIASQVAELVRRLGAHTPFGGDVVREISGRYYGVAFSCGHLAGVVLVYSPEYLTVKYTAHMEGAPISGLPSADSRTFDHPDKVAKFLMAAIHTRQYAEALAIPQRQKKTKVSE